MSYDPKNCQSLFGYGKNAHERSGGICVYCGIGADKLDFDIWRQFSIDHVIPRRLLPDINKVFPNIEKNKELIRALRRKIDGMNLVTACNFCNSMTSRMPIEPIKNILRFDDYENATSIDDEPFKSMLCSLEKHIQEQIVIKRDYVQKRLSIIREEFGKVVEPTLLKKRIEMDIPHYPI